MPYYSEYANVNILTKMNILTNVNVLTKVYILTNVNILTKVYILTDAYKVKDKILHLCF